MNCYLFNYLIKAEMIFFFFFFFFHPLYLYKTSLSLLKTINFINILLRDLNLCFTAGYFCMLVEVHVLS